MKSLERFSFFIPTPGQYEQIYLAKKFKKEGIAPYCNQEDFKIEKLDEIENNEVQCFSKLEKRRIEKLALKHESVKELLDEYRNTANVIHAIQKEEYDGVLKLKNITPIHEYALNAIPIKLHA